MHTRNHKSRWEKIMNNSENRISIEIVLGFILIMFSGIMFTFVGEAEGSFIEILLAAILTVGVMGFSGYVLVHNALEKLCFLRIRKEPRYHRHYIDSIEQDKAIMDEEDRMKMEGELLHLREQAKRVRK